MHAGIQLTEIALVVVAALGCGLVFERFKQPAVLGYILAGVLLGPSALGLVEDRAFIHALAELGILMLLFLIGMELNIRSFKAHIWVSLLTMVAQIAISLVVVLGIGKLFSLSFGLSVLLACAIALSSTAVAIKMLESMNELGTPTGRVAIGVLIAQDLAVVPMILVLRELSSPDLNPLVFTKVGASLLILGGLIWYLGRRDQITLPYVKIASTHGDLKPLAAMVFCFGAASISGLIGLSAAYGAFLGGLILGNTKESKIMIEATHPIQSLLMMVFFLSIGLLMDFHYIWHNLFKVLTLLALITLGKTAFNISILRLFRIPWAEAFLAGLVLSQMGEFAFLLASIGGESELIDQDGQRLVVSLAVLSLTLSPFWMAAARRLHDAAPQKRENLNQLLSSVYGPQMATLHRLGCAFIKTMKELFHLLEKGVKNILEKLRKSPSKPDDET